MRVFRKSVFAAIVILVVAGAAESSRATVLLSDGFDSDTTGKLPGTPFSGYESPATGAASSNVVADTSNLFGAGTSNHILSITDTDASSNTYAQATGIAGATTVETLSFDYYEPTDPNSGSPSPLYVYIGAGGVNTSSNDVIAFQLNDGTISGGTGQNYSISAPHLIQIVANNSTQSVTISDGTTISSQRAAIYVDGQLQVNNGYNSNTIAKGTALSSFGFLSYTSSADQQAYIDNVQLVDSASIPEPTGLCAMLVAGGAGLMRRRRA